MAKASIVFGEDDALLRAIYVKKFSLAGYDVAPGSNREEVLQLIQGEINKVNDQLARVENIRKFRILDKKLYTEDGEVTPTMKVKRKFINAQYHDLIESMYRDG